MIAKTYQPGIYRQMRDAEYRAIPALSNSDLIAWAQGRDIDKRVADIGSAAHAVCLEPEVARERVIGLEPGQKRKDHPLYESDEHYVLAHSDYRKVVGMYKSAVAGMHKPAKDIPATAKVLDYARQHREACELVIVFPDPETDILCKMKLDLLTPNALWDIKTTGSDREGFEKSVGAFAYHLQQAHYLIGADQAGLGGRTFRFLCMNKRADWGHPAWITEIDEPMGLAGMRERSRLMNLYKRFGASNENQ